MRVLIRVSGLSQWACSDLEPPLILEEGQHELDLDEVGVAAVAAAAAAGVGVELLEQDADTRKLAKNAVEPDAVSLKRAPTLVAEMDDDARDAWQQFLDTKADA